MAQLSGSIIVVTDNASPVSASVDIPVGTTAVIIASLGYSAQFNHTNITTWTLDGDPFTLIYENDNQTDYEQIMAGYLVSPTTGTVTLAGSWTGSAPDSGFAILVIPLQDCDITDLLISQGANAYLVATSTTNPNIGALTGSAGDLSIGIASNYGATVPTMTGGTTPTNGSGTYNGMGYRVNTGDGGVDFTVTAGGSFATLLGIVVRNAAGGGSDTTPDAFSFTDQTGIALSTQVESNTITVAGIDAAAAISITGGGAEYRINAGAYTTAAGTVNNGDTVQLRMTSSATGGTVVSTTLDIGGVTDVWTVTTLVAADLAASYAASAFVSADLAASYGAAGLVASDLAVSYSARELVNADLAASYAATAFVSADLAISYAGLGLAVYFREKLVNLSEAPLANLTGLIAFVWHAEPSGSNVAPDEVLTSLTTDANGDPDWQLDLGSLANGDPVWLMVIRPGGPPYALTARRVVPTYVEE